MVADDKIGAVLVVGAGIGGIQASLDLAEAGLKVYLLESSPAIGGVMAQLDKTFPTNDCAMCILSPKLVECGRHLNIDVITCAELESLSGEPGRYVARVRKKPRYVIEDECTGCGDCAEACPVSRPDLFNLGLSDRRAAYKLYPQAIPNAYVIEKLGRAPCRDACPIQQRTQGYIALVRERRFADAYRTIREDNPFPSICGRVCNHVCEEVCSRGKADEAVSIMRLKRFVADWAAAHPAEIDALAVAEVPEQGNPGNRGRVAVVGAGPAGLACGESLARMGYTVTVFEALSVPGGMMRVGIPAHRLPREIVEREIASIRDTGVDIRLNHRVTDATALLQGFDAVFVAAGAHSGMRLPIPGADLPQVIVATDFLRDVAMGALDSATGGLGQEGVAGKRVLVLGGGSVAMDSATSALRLGAAWVGMACLESRDAMPAHEWEIVDAVEEGVRLFPSRTFKEIVAANGRAHGVRCAEIDFRGFVDGRPDFDKMPDSEHLIEADVVIFAIGQRPDLSCLPVESRGRGGYALVDPVTLATPVAGVFAGGDAATGTRFVVDAIAAGKRAARSIDAHVRGEPLRAAEPREAVSELSEMEAMARVTDGAASGAPRQEAAKLEVGQRTSGFGEVYASFTEAEAIAEAERCLSCGVCSECLQCVYVCQKDCIDHDMGEETLHLPVGAVILTPGLQPMAGDIRPEYGYGRLANVVTSIEFERMLSASGPWGGVVQRPSDGKHPQRVAFIQCVGCRDTSLDQGYCSSVCCMVATKEAVIAKEHDPSVEPSVFYMDIRSYGKGFERYVSRAEGEYGVRYVRSMVSAVTEVAGTGDLRLRYATPEGSNTEEVFDLVVLSVGLQPSGEARALADRLGVAQNEYGFAEAPAFRPTRTSRPDGTLAKGIFAAGAFGEPKDIPETVTGASCAAAQASALLGTARGTLIEEQTWPDERDVSDEPPRVGVFICHCGINIGAVVNVPEVVDYAGQLPDVVYAERNLYTCSQDTQERIRELIPEHELNRVVVASCTPRTHEPLFQETIRRAGLNPHLFHMANIREQVSWVHRDDHTTATAKAKDLVRMAVAKSRRLRSLEQRSSEVVRRALVIGGGLAGMAAALSIAEQGYGVTLVERERDLGGNLRHILTPLGPYPAQAGGDDPADPQALLSRMVDAVTSNPRIDLMVGAEIEDVGGYVGAFSSTVRDPGGERREVQHGVIVVATGAQQVEPQDYLYGQDERVITQRDLETRLANGDPSGAAGDADRMPAGVRSVVMIQCVGSRDDEHPYCSRVCCTEAIKNSIAIKELHPATRVYVLYRDIRSYGFKEQYYREARRRGVLFLEYDADRRPQVRQQNGRLLVDVVMQPEDELFELEADLVVLSAGLEPNPDNRALAQLLNVPLNEDGFFLEAHTKLRPLDCAAEGIFLCGMAHSPRFLDETIAQAQGAAVRAVGLLSKDELDATPTIATVNPRLCSACGLCVEVCPYNARVLEPGMPNAEVIDVLCQGCGACVVACPNKASQQKGFEVAQFLGVLSAISETG